MDPQQYRLKEESISLCRKLLDEAELDRDRIRGCFDGELRSAYIKSNEYAEKEIKEIRNRLQAIP